MGVVLVASSYNEFRVGVGEVDLSLGCGYRVIFVVLEVGSDGTAM